MSYLYVDSSNGDDNNTGLAHNSAVKTIKKALDISIEGDICVMLPSDNYYTINNKITNLGTFGHTIKIIGFGTKTTLYFSDSASSNVLLNNFCVMNCIIENGYSSTSLCYRSNPNGYTCIFYNILFKGEYMYLTPDSPVTYVPKFVNCTWVSTNLNTYAFFGTAYCKNCIRYLNTGYDFVKEYTEDSINNISAAKSLFNNQYIAAGYEALGYSDTSELFKDYPEVKQFYKGTLIRSNNKVYSIALYDPDSKMYVPMDSVDFDNYGFSYMDLCKEITVGEETFCPIDKFDSFQILSLLKNPYMVYAYKNMTELIVDNSDIHLSHVQSIDFFNIKFTNINSGLLHVALSIDSGDSWLTWDNTINNFVPLSCSIPKDKAFSSFTDKEKADWFHAAIAIKTYGIPANIFQTINFNVISDTKQVRFAYALTHTSLEDTVKITQLNWQYDANGFMQMMGNDEYQVYIHGDFIRMKSNINNDIIQVNTML